MFVNNIDTALTALEEEIKKLKSKAELIITPYKKINLINIYELNKINDYRLYLKNYNGYPIEVKNKEEVEKAYNDTLKILENLKEKIKKEHEDNIPALEHNKKIEEKIKLMMEIVGIKPTYRTYFYKTSRSKTKREKTNIAGYISDIKRVIPLDDKYEYFLNLIKKKKERITEIRTEMLKKFNKKELEERKKLNEIKKTKLLINLALKYGIDIDITEEIEPNIIKDFLLEKDKYLKLAYALEKNRSDWTDGYSIVKYALKEFNIENEIDKEIFDEINSVIDENWDYDGRIFRDINYSYNTLYDLVENKELLKDFETLTEYI